jgi:hypothetical protein
MATSRNPRGRSASDSDRRPVRSALRRRLGRSSVSCSIPASVPARRKRPSHAASRRSRSGRIAQVCRRSTRLRFSRGRSSAGPDAARLSPPRRSRPSGQRHSLNQSVGERRGYVFKSRPRYLRRSARASTAGKSTLAATAVLDPCCSSNGSRAVSIAAVRGAESRPQPPAATRPAYTQQQLASEFPQFATSGE